MYSTCIAVLGHGSLELAREFGECEIVLLADHRGQCFKANLLKIIRNKIRTLGPIKKFELLTSWTRHSCTNTDQK